MLIWQRSGGLTLLLTIQEGQNPASLASHAGHTEIVDIINKGSSGSYPAFSYTASFPFLVPTVLHGSR